MSWSAQYATKNALLEKTPTYPISELSLGAADQLAHAKQYALDLVASGVVGRSDKEFAFYFSGHSNPDHEPTPGYANDCITVTVSQTSPVIASAPPPATPPSDA